MICHLWLHGMPSASEHDNRSMTMPTSASSRVRDAAPVVLFEGSGTQQRARSVRPLGRLLLLITAVMCVLPNAHALPSFARQTGQRCAACHVGGDWPQLTPWGRFFKLSGYTAGKPLIDKEGIHYVPFGVLRQAGLAWAAQPNNTQGQPVVTQK